MGIIQPEDRRTETRGLAQQYPEKAKAMKARWNEMANTETKVKPDYRQSVKGDSRPWGLGREGKPDRRQSAAGEIKKQGGNQKNK